MRAGKLDTPITIQRHTTAVDDYGTPTDTWSDLATVRAQVIQASTEEFIRAAGAVDETLVIFRIRHRDGLTNADRVMHDGRPHNVREVKVIGRRKGLELRTQRLGDG